MKIKGVLIIVLFVGLIGLGIGVIYGNQIADFLGGALGLGALLGLNKRGSKPDDGKAAELAGSSRDAIKRADDAGTTSDSASARMDDVVQDDFNTVVRGPGDDLLARSEEFLRRVDEGKK